MEVACPHCGFKEVVFNQYDGMIGICGKCGYKYTLGGKIERSESSNLECRRRINEIGDVITRVTDDKVIAPLREEILGLKDEIEKRYLTAQVAAVHNIEKKFPFFLKPLRRFFVKRRVPGVEEISLGHLARDIDGLLQAIDNRSKEIEKERKRKLVISRLKDDVRTAIECIKTKQSLPPKECKFFSYQEGEIVHYVAHNIDCIVPRQTKCEHYEGGRFVLTNKRVVYTAEQHMQEYNIKRIRDFKPCWRLDTGWITLATSDKRKERYKFNEGWFPSILILFLSNDMFMEQVITKSVNSSVAYVWNKIVATSSPLHSILFDAQEENDNNFTSKSIARVADDMELTANAITPECIEFMGDEIDVLLGSDEINESIKSDLEWLQEMMTSMYSTRTECESAYKKYLKMRSSQGFVEIVEASEKNSNLKRRSDWLMCV